MRTDKIYIYHLELKGLIASHTYTRRGPFITDPTLNSSTILSNLCYIFFSSCFNYNFVIFLFKYMYSYIYIFLFYHNKKGNVTPDFWHVTCDTWHTEDGDQVLSSHGLGVMMFWRLGGKGSLTDWMNELIS